MALTIAEAFGELGITIQRPQILQMEKVCTYFTLKKTHPLTLHGIALGVDPIAFMTSDYDALFDIFGLSAKTIEKLVYEIPAIDRNFAVISDPFNLFSMWLVHLAPIYIKDKRICHNFQMQVLRYYHYKIFTSVVNNSFRHGTNPGIMAATIARLTRKSDIIRYESWYTLIDTHCEKILDPQDRFYHTVITATPDDAFLRVIGESQTALRAKIVTFAQAYYEAYSAGDSVGSVSSVSTNDEGEKILIQTASVIESASQSMVSEILNPNTFVHDIAIHDIVTYGSDAVSARMLKTALLKINETAVLQAASRTFDQVKTDKEGTLYIGVRVLVMEILRSMVRLCRSRRVNMGNHQLVFKTMRDVYQSSRSQDTDILDIKRSVEHLIDPLNITSNDASKSALRLCVIYYILYRTILKMKT